MSEPMHKRYEAQPDLDRMGYRITDTVTDARVATCSLETFAKLVVTALNAHEEANKAQKTK